MKKSFETAAPGADVIKLFFCTTDNENR